MVNSPVAHIQIKYCTSQREGLTGHGSERLFEIRGLNGVHSLLEANPLQRQSLHHYLQNFSTVRLEFRVDATMLDLKDDDGNAFDFGDLLDRIFFLQQIDAQRFLVDALNASRAIRKLEVCCNFCDNYGY